MCAAYDGAMTDLDRLRNILSRNEILVELLRRAREFGLPDWYLTAGCVVQTVGNVLSDREPAHGIKDYDLFYHDPADPSWAAEDRVIRAVARACEDLPVEVEV